MAADVGGPMAQQPSSVPSKLPNPRIQPCRYKTGRTLGAGSYSVVKECVHAETGRYYAAKVINKRLMAGREHMVRNEIAVLKRISMGHRHILTLVDYFETMNNLYLITDLALGGELFDRICRKGSYFESDAADLIRTTLSAVDYLHGHGIVHRDLKPENLLFKTPEENADLLIADFGLSKIMEEESFHVLTTTCGTPGYMAPEIFKKSGHGKPVDIWAIGVITYFLLCGYTPFDRDSNLEEMHAILAADFSFTPGDYWHNVSQMARDFITRCLTVDPKKRMTAREALKHRWLADRESEAGEDLLPVIKKNFNARKTLHAAIDTVRAINQLRSGAETPTRTDGTNKQQHKNNHKYNHYQHDDDKNTKITNDSHNELKNNGNHNTHQNGDQNSHGNGYVDAEGGQHQDEMVIDSRGNARGQTHEMIKEQQRRIFEAQQNLWRK